MNSPSSDFLILLHIGQFDNCGYLRHEALITQGVIHACDDSVFVFEIFDVGDDDLVFGA